MSTNPSRFIRYSHSEPDGVRVCADGNLVCVRVETKDHAIPVDLTPEQARELAHVLNAFATVVDSQESEIME